MKRRIIQVGAWSALVLPTLGVALVFCWVGFAIYYFREPVLTALDNWYSSTDGYVSGVLSVKAVVGATGVIIIWALLCLSWWLVRYQYNVWKTFFSEK